MPSKLWVLEGEDGVHVICSTEAVAKEFLADFPTADIIEWELYDSHPDEVDVHTWMARWGNGAVEPNLPTRTSHKQRIDLPPPVNAEESSDFFGASRTKPDYWVRVRGTDKDLVEQAFDEMVAAVIAERMGLL